MTTFFTSYCKGASKDSKNLNIARHERKLQGYDDGRTPMQQSNFSDAVNQNDDGNELVVQKALTTGISLMSHCKRSNDNYIFDVTRSGLIARECGMTVSQPSQDTRTQQSNF
jgi:hypothetical protein